MALIDWTRDSSANPNPKSTLLFTLFQSLKQIKSLSPTLKHIRSIFQISCTTLMPWSNQSKVEIRLIWLVSTDWRSDAARKGQGNSIQNIQVVNRSNTVRVLLQCAYTKCREIMSRSTELCEGLKSHHVTSHRSKAKQSKALEDCVFRFLIGSTYKARSSHYIARQCRRDIEKNVVEV
jgi:hypothetical protein